MKKGIVLFLVLAAAGVGCIPKYIGWNSTLVAPSGSNGSSFSDDKIDIMFRVDKMDVSFLLKNKTSQGIKINWDEISLVMPAGDTQKTIHKGVNLASAGLPQALSTIPPQTTLSDYLTPIGLVYQTQEGLILDELFPEYIMTRISKGNRARSFSDKNIVWENQTFSIYFPMEIEGSRKDYNFTLRLDSRIREKTK